MHNYKRILVDGVSYYGKHLILTAISCNENIIDKDAILKFLTTLVPKIDMVAYGKPIIERFGQGIEAGISAVQLIETSAIIVHTNDLAKDAYLDVFSCKGFNEEIVISEFGVFFEPTTMNHQILLRK